MSELPKLGVLMAEYDNALAYTDELWKDLTEDEVYWRPDQNSSAIGWHLGHQPVVAHFMVRNLTAAEPKLDPRFDEMMDSAKPEPERAPLPPLHLLDTFRADVARRVKFRVGNINRGHVGAPTQMRSIATVMMTSIINHEYQHSVWIGEVRTKQFGYDLPDLPESDLLSDLDGYPIIQLG
ncbi:MAG: DinB family protein [Acidimicrobiales bacterium]|nr:DinB family protein [Acidimicrobiales bacterium]